QIASMDVIDPLTLRFTLKVANTVFPSALYKISFIGSPTAIQQMGDKYASAPVAAGPFILKTWQRDNQTILERNPNYWNKPLPYLDRVVVKIIVDESQRFNALCAGEAQEAQIISVSSVSNNEQRKCVDANPIVQNGGVIMLMK